jgi:hypothetical protein
MVIPPDVDKEIAHVATEMMHTDLSVRTYLRKVIFNFCLFYTRAILIHSPIDPILFRMRH